MEMCSLDSGKTPHDKVTDGNITRSEEQVVGNDQKMSATVSTVYKVSASEDDDRCYDTIAFTSHPNYLTD